METGFRRDASEKSYLGRHSLSNLLEQLGVETPAYFYDLEGITHHARELQRALVDQPHLIAYAVKANSAGSIVRCLANLGIGADVVSGGELKLALGAGVAAHRIVMSGVAKTDAEIDYAISAEIAALQAESVEELIRINARASALSRRACVSIRVNPNIGIDSHAHVATGHDAAKFGVPLPDISAALRYLDESAPHLTLVGISTHVGSMLSTVDPYLASAKIVCDIAQARQSSGGLRFVDFGGGFGIDYDGRPTVPPMSFANAAKELLRQSGLAHLQLVIEPGRSLVGPFGVLVARVIQAKRGRDRRWLMIDAGMNDLIRPALYGAKHRIESITEAPGALEWRVVGPVCESSDDFGVHHFGENPPQAVVIRDAGAYGFVMASEYNGRRMPNEVFLTAQGAETISLSPTIDSWVQRRLST